MLLLLTLLTLMATATHGLPPVSLPGPPTFVGTQPHTRPANAAISKRAPWSGWAGPSVYADASNPITSVSGMLRVPSCWGSENMGPGPLFHAATWVGLDGASGDGAGLLQAGVVCQYDVTSGNGTQSAFLEYFPAAMQLISFPVSDGQDLTVTITQRGATEGEVVLQNYETGDAMTTTLSAPVPSATLPGASAMWIVERFGIDGNPCDFGGFETLLWAGVKATRADGSVINPQAADDWVMTNDLGDVVSSTAYDAPDEPRVDFTGRVEVHGG